MLIVDVDCVQQDVEFVEFFDGFGDYGFVGVVFCEVGLDQFVGGFCGGQFGFDGCECGGVLVDYGYGSVCCGIGQGIGIVDFFSFGYDYV